MSRIKPKRQSRRKNSSNGAIRTFLLIFFSFKPDKNVSFESPRKHTCDECGAKLASQQNLNEHITRIHRKLKSYECNELLEDERVCGQKFVTKKELQRHINEVHLDLGPFECDECGFPFKTRANLEHHIETVHRKRGRHRCKECGGFFSSKYNLNEHIARIHRGEKPFVCSEQLEDGTACGRAFPTEADLRKHINRIHLKLKPHVCDVCGYQFPTKGELDRHITHVHSGQREFICNDPLDDGTICGKSFAMQGDLKSHIDLIHKGIRPHLCSKCGKPFGRADARDNHERKCSGISDESLKIKYHIKKGLNVEDVIGGIIEENSASSGNVTCTEQKELLHPTLGGGKVDIYCYGLEGKRIAIDITTTNYKDAIMRKWYERRYQEYPDVDEFWVIVCSNDFDKKACDELTRAAHKNPKYQNVYVYHWTDLQNVKMMTIPPKIWKLLELYEKCTLKNKEECKKYWEEVKGRFHTF